MNHNKYEPGCLYCLSLQREQKDMRYTGDDMPLMRKSVKDGMIRYEAGPVMSWGMAHAMLKANLYPDTGHF